MNAADSIPLSGPLSDSQKAALLTLLADEDPAVYRPIREALISRGPEVTTWLRRHRLSHDPLLRRRTQEIIRHFERQEADDRFLAFCLNQGEELDLEAGAWLLAQTGYPDINVAGYQALLDQFADQLGNRIQNLSQPEDLLPAINGYLFEELGFCGNEENYYDPENSYLNRVLDRRTGNPINLSLVYILVTRRLRLPVAGIGLPGHFICRYQTSAAEVYIDPFGRGKLLSKSDCIQYLLQGNYSLREDYLAPATPRRMLLRICGNLHQIYDHLGHKSEVTRLQRYLVALSSR